MTQINIFLFLAIIFVNSLAKKLSSNRTEISVYIKNGQYTIKEGLYSDADVNAYFIDSMMETGWGILEVLIQNTSTALDAQKAFAAGLAEGYLTSSQIYDAYLNTLNTSYWNFWNGPTEDVANFINAQQSWMESQIKLNLNDPFWQYANILNEQLIGLQYGYNLSAINNNIPTYQNNWPFVFLNLAGDLLDLIPALNVTARPDWYNMDANDFIIQQGSRGHCSAIVKVSPLLDDLMIGHSTWFTFQDMNRIFKHYIFNFKQIPIATKHMMFSSYPGYLESWDDYYIMDSGLAMLQTTNNIPNTTLYDYVVPQSLWSWQRVRISNALASTGPEWYSYISRANSGTYNNQYMIINYNLFQPQQPLANNLLFVIEQIPGFVYGEDKTDVLERSYWGSYNVPALEIIYNMSGYPQLVEAQGVTASYDLAPRARIFRRDAGSIETLQDLKNFLRYNDYKNDPIQDGSPWYAICARGDLDPNSPIPHGCYDTKVANITMILNMQTDAISSPTYDDLPPFSWNDWPTYIHYGVPNTLQFGWYWMQSELES